MANDEKRKMREFLGRLRRADERGTSMRLSPEEVRSLADYLRETAEVNHVPVGSAYSNELQNPK